jgi:hypothetical protein
MPVLDEYTTENGDMCTTSHPDMSGSGEPCHCSRMEIFQRKIDGHTDLEPRSRTGSLLTIAVINSNGIVVRRFVGYTSVEELLSEMYPSR